MRYCISGAIACVVVLLHSCGGCLNEKENVRTEVNAIKGEVDSCIDETMKENGVPGATVAIVKNGKVIYQHNYGNANLEHNVPVTDSSTFRLYSLTKPFVAVGIFQLIEKGEIELEDRVSQYIESLPNHWSEVKIKHLLSFSSGLPEMLTSYVEVRDLSESSLEQKVFGKALRFKCGQRFDYNQTNFWLLQKVVEKVSGTNLSDYILQNQFSSKTHDAFFSSDARDIIPNRVTPYFPFEKGSQAICHPYYSGDFSHAMNGLHLSLEAFIEWDKSFSSFQFLCSKMRDRMWVSFPYIEAEIDFAFGWARFVENGSESYGFSGSGCTIYRTYPRENVTIIYLSNGFSNPYDLNQLVDQLHEITIR